MHQGGASERKGEGECIGCVSGNGSRLKVCVAFDIVGDDGSVGTPAGIVHLLDEMELVGEGIVAAGNEIGVIVGGHGASGLGVAGIADEEGMSLIGGDGGIQLVGGELVGDIDCAGGAVGGAAGVDDDADAVSVIDECLDVPVGIVDKIVEVDIFVVVKSPFAVKADREEDMMLLHVRSHFGDSDLRNGIDVRNAPLILAEKRVDVILGHEAGDGKGHQY